MKARYAIVLERSSTDFGASVPDLPWCVAVAASEDDVRQLIREAIQFHLEGMREAGEPIPEPPARVDYVEIPQAA